MYSPYGFHSMSEQYRREALRVARTRHLERHLRADSRARSAPSHVAALRSALATLRAADADAAERARS